MSSGQDAANNQSLYLGLGVGVGGLLVIGIIAVIIQIVRRSRQYKNAHTLEAGVASAHHPVETAQINHGCAEHKWEALSSKEDVSEPLPSRKSIIPAFHLPKRMKKRGIALRRLKHLSAIVESPRSQQAVAMPALVENTRERPETWPLPVKDVFVDELPAWEGLFADRPRAPRSVSVNALIETKCLQRSFSGNVGIRHVRSVSLGAEPPARLPPDPVPQEVIPPLGQEPDRRMSRDSYDSEASAGSSVLVNSPFMNRRKTPRFVTADHPSSFRMKKSANRVVVINGSHDPEAHAVDRVGSKMSLMSTDRATMSAGADENRAASRVSLLTDDEKTSRGYLVSSSSVSSLDDDGRSNSMSTFQFPTRSVKSPRSTKSKRSIRRVSRFSVSADGSPSGRQRSGVLQDICSNALPQREPSSASLQSTNSSDGNPFQWDGVPLKPSAMKGSPNARKGHRRQNCVRISTLTPQVLGPPPSRPDSPSITHGIQEESETSPKLTFLTNRKPSRPNSVGPNNSLRVKALRASLTPSSPTLSLWATYSDCGLPSQPSDSHLTVSSAGRLSRTASGISSIYSIPQFPSPSTVTVSQVQHDRPVPEFCVSSPADVDSSSSPFALQSESGSRAWRDSTRKRPRETSPSEEDTLTTSRVQWSSRPPSTVSLRSMDATRSGSERPFPQSAFELTSENASSSLHNAGSVGANPAFPGAPVLAPPAEDASWSNIQLTPANNHRRCSRGSPSGPRIEPAKSVSKIAMELRRMNSEIDMDHSRESRRYLRFDREASPVLPMFGSPNPSESCASLFDFGFDEPSQTQNKPSSPSLSVINEQTPQQALNKMLSRGILKNKPGTPNSLYDADGFLQA